MYDAILQKSDTISEKWMPQFLTFLDSFVWRFVLTRKGRGAHVKSWSSGIIDAVIIATQGGLGGPSLSHVALSWDWNDILPPAKANVRVVPMHKKAPRLLEDKRCSD